MKALATLLFAIVTLFLGQKQPPTPSIKQTKKNVLAASTSQIPLPSGPEQCHANQVNPADPQSYLPDKNCTPGITNPDVTQANIYTTICVAGFTKTIRPPASYTNQLKYQQIKNYGYTDTNPKDYEEDHLISLELGGNPSDPKNLWPEPHPSTNEKDTVENYLHKQVCSGQIPLAQAQNEIREDWYAVYKQIK